MDTIWKAICVFDDQFSITIIVMLHAVLDLTPEQLERHKCMLSSVATDAQVLKHQATSTHSTDKISTTE